MSGELPQAAVAGVHVQATPTSSTYVWAAGMLSPQGRCGLSDERREGFLKQYKCTADEMKQSSLAVASAMANIMLVGCRCMSNVIRK